MKNEKMIPETYNLEYYKKYRKYFDYKKTHLIFAKNIKKLFNPKNVLDLGCGTGSTVFAFHKIKINCKGIDFADDLLSVANPQIKKFLVKQDITRKLPFKNEEFDLIIADNVFEHLDNDEFVLKECLRCLTPKGRIIIIVPKITCIAPGHINLKKRGEWIKLFKRYGILENLVIDRKFFIPIYLPFEKSLRKIIHHFLRPNIFILKKS